MAINILIEDIYSPVSYEGFENAIVIIGVASIGPAMIPVYLTPANDVVRIFGENSEITNTCIEAFEAGASNVIAIRMNGVSSTLTFLDNQGEKAIIFKSISAEGNSDNCRIAVMETEDGLVVVGVYGKDSNLEREYTLPRTTPISTLCSRINRDALYGYVSILATPIKNITVSDLDKTNEFGLFMDGGSDESSLFQLEILNKLEIVYGMIESLAFDILIPLPVRYLEFEMIWIGEKIERINLYNQLSDFCRLRAAAGMPIISLIQTFDEISNNTDSILNKYEELLDSMDFSQYIIPISGGLRSPVSYISSGIGVVSGFLNALPVESSPINKTIHRGLGLKYHLTSSELATMKALKVSCFTSSIRRGVVLFNENTSAYNQESPFASIRNIRLVNFITRKCTALFDSHIGDTTPTPFNVITSKIESLFDGFRSDNIISDYQYTVRVDESTKVTIEIEVVPYGQIESVTTSVRVYG